MSHIVGAGAARVGGSGVGGVGELDGVSSSSRSGKQALTSGNKLWERMTTPGAGNEGAGKGGSTEEVKHDGTRAISYRFSCMEGTG